MKKRVIALLLCAVMLVTCMGVGVFTSSDKLDITVDGEAVESVSVPQLGKVELSAKVDADSAAYRWQFSSDGDTWIDIYGETGESCTLTYAKVKNMLNDEGTAQLRCIVSANGEEKTSTEVSVSVEQAPVVAAAPAKVAAAPAKVAAAPADVAPAANGAKYTVTVKYVYENGGDALEALSQSFDAGESVNWSIPYPTINGYSAKITDADGMTVSNVAETGSTIGIDAINRDYTVVVTYSAKTVDYTVTYYYQQVTGDGYDSQIEHKRAEVDTALPQDSDIADKPGYVLQQYEKARVEADGSTNIAVYYDREYYLVTFDCSEDALDVPEAIYARYGTPLGSIQQPTRVNYRLTYWTDDAGNTVDLNTATVPDKNVTYTAHWDLADKNAKVSIVYWGENADDEGYSYLSTKEVTAPVGSNYTASNNLNNILGCGKSEHTHDASCHLICGHGNQHTLACFGLSQRNPVDATKDGDGNGPEYFEKTGYLVSGSVCHYYNYRATHRDQDFYYIYLNGQYYSITETDYNRLKGDNGEHESHGWGQIDRHYVAAANSICNHPNNHIDSCYDCGQIEHTHSSACNIAPNLYDFISSETKTVRADGTTVVNVYLDRKSFTWQFGNSSSSANRYYGYITAKWGANVSDQYKAISQKVYERDSGPWRVVGGGTAYTEILTHMGTQNVNYYKSGTAGNEYEMAYWLQKIDAPDAHGNIEGTHSSEANYDKVYYAMWGSGFTTTAEDYIEITGFTCAYKPDVGTENESGLNLYYTRNKYTLTLNDGKTNIASFSVQYEKDLGTVSGLNGYVPERPDTIDSHYHFAGWYRSPQGNDGKVEFSGTKMPAADMILYAHWEPDVYEVNFFHDSSLANKISGPEEVAYNEKIANIPATPTEPKMKFVGWFYMDNGVEKAFDPVHMRVAKSMDLYAKWSSNSMKSYFVYYKDQATGEEVATPKTGEASVGKTLQLAAKTSTQLKKEYQNGYFPTESNATLTITEDGDNIYTFWYVKTTVSYTVRYLELNTNKQLLPDKTVTGYEKSIVTESFVPIPNSKYIPVEPYQQTVMLTTGKNEIIFYYKEDPNKVAYLVNHYTVSADGTETLYAAEDAKIVDIGTGITVAIKSIDNYTFDLAMTKDGSTCTVSRSGDQIKATIPEGGAVVNLYYKENTVTVKYEASVGGDVDPAEETVGIVTGTFAGSTAAAENGYSFDGWYSDAEHKNLLSNKAKYAPSAKQDVTYYAKFVENEATIQYKVVGPDGTVYSADSEVGKLTSYSETVGVVTGKLSGSKAEPASNVYKFVGWYSDAKCEHKVSDGYNYVPEKNSDGMYEAATYYAKFEYNLTSMTLRKEVTGGAYDANDMFIFTIKDSKDNVFAKVTVTAGEEVTISGLTVGEEYTITEDNNWSWRYTDKNPIEFKMTADPDINVVEVTNTLNTNKWLGASSYAINQCVNTISYKINEFFEKLIG